MQPKTALVLLAEGFEELEAIAPIDLLRRAGVDCTVASIGVSELVEGRNGIRVRADKALDEVRHRQFDCVVVPGGPATAKLREDPRVIEIVRAHAAADRVVAAICAAPTVLLDAGVLATARHTGHASICSELPNIEADRAVVVDGGVITSRGAGTALEFALALVAALTNRQGAEAVAEAIHFRSGDGCRSFLLT